MKHNILISPQPDTVGANQNLPTRAPEDTPAHTGPTRVLTICQAQAVVPPFQDCQSNILQKSKQRQSQLLVNLSTSSSSNPHETEKSNLAGRIIVTTLDNDSQGSRSRAAQQGRTAGRATCRRHLTDRPRATATPALQARPSERGATCAVLSSSTALDQSKGPSHPPSCG